MVREDFSTKTLLPKGRLDGRKSRHRPGPIHDDVARTCSAFATLIRRAKSCGAGFHQAGFRAELLERFVGRKHAPVLFQDGEAHQKQRSATARFFAPKVVGTRYRELMENLSERLIERFRLIGHAELDAMSLEMAVAVAAEIVGLTESAQAGMAERLNRFFAASGPQKGWLSAIAGFAAGQYKMLALSARRSAGGPGPPQSAARGRDFASA